MEKTGLDIIKDIANSSEFRITFSGHRSRFFEDEHACMFIEMRSTGDEGFTSAVCIEASVECDIPEEKLKSCLLHLQDELGKLQREQAE